MLITINGKYNESWAVKIQIELAERKRTAQVVSANDPNKSDPKPKISFKIIPTHIYIYLRSSRSPKSQPISIEFEKNPPPNLPKKAKNEAPSPKPATSSNS